MDRGIDVFTRLENYGCSTLAFLMVGLVIYAFWADSYSHTETHRINGISHVVFHTTHKYTFFTRQGNVEEATTIYFGKMPLIIRDVAEDDFCWAEYSIEYSNGGAGNVLSGTIHLHSQTPIGTGEHSYRKNKEWHTEQPEFLE